ncbi:MAG: Bax inhibitor-1/YccA family protein [Methyloligellaceae bacterium]
MAYDQENTFRTRSGAGVDAHAIDEGLRAYMLKVYNYMALGIAFTAVVSLFLMSNPPLLFALYFGLGGWAKWIIFAAIIGMGFFSNKLILEGSTALAHAAFWIYAALWAVFITPFVFKFVQAGNTHIVFQAFAVTAAAFASLSLYGYTTKRDLSPIGAFCCMALVGMLVIGLIAMFTGGFANNLFSLGFSALMVLIIAAMTAWETQSTKEMYFAGDGQDTTNKKAIFGAFHLYASFVMMFIHILNILGIMGGDD